MSSAMKQLLGSSYLFGGNAPFVEELYEPYLNNPQSVPERVARVLRQHAGAAGAAATAAATSRTRRSSSRSRSARSRARCAPAAAPTELGVERKQVYVQQLINAYRFLGNALGGARSAQAPAAAADPGARARVLRPDRGRPRDACSTPARWSGRERATLREILQMLRETYCGTIGVEYMYISDPAQKRWIQQRLEAVRGRAAVRARDAKRRLLERLTAAETLEKYLHTRYVGQKRFSLEGGETLIPMLDEIVQRAGRARRRGGRDRHGAPRAPQRARQHPRQVAEGPVRGVRGQAREHEHLARRREVPPGLLVRRLDAGRAGAPHARVQPVAPRDREPGGRRLGARAPAPAQRHARATR